MSSLNKIHVNNSTNISLNDRFTMIQTLSSPGEPKVLRLNDNTVKGSAKNTQLINQLEKRRKIMAALKIKRRSLRRNLHQRIGNNTKMMHDLVNNKSNGRLRRTNSLAAIATMKADKIQKPIQRRNSVTIADRLGYRRGGSGSIVNRRDGTGLRRPLNRNNFNNLRRSNSKQNLNLKLQQNRPRSKGNPNTSANNGGQNRSRSRSRSRSNIRNRSVPKTNTNVNNRSRSRSRSNIRTRSNSVNSRLGTNRTSAPVTVRERRGRIIKGRVFRRSVPNNGASNNVQARRGRSRTRSVPRGQIQRQRSRSRSRPNTDGRNNSTRGQRRGGVRRGSGTSTRGRSNARGRGVAPDVKVQKSKEELDKELELYMENTKDQEMQYLINGS